MITVRFLWRRLAGAFALAIALAVSHGIAMASDFSEPWKRKDRALVIDAYEYNELDWEKLKENKRLTGFIGKGSDGLAPPYSCRGEEVEIRLCKALWKRYSVARELYHTRRALAKSIGLKWGVYHLGRPGNPVDQANHLIDFAEPDGDDLIALDIEGNDPELWMSLNDAEIFARHIRFRLGRYPILYTNGATARFIADNRLRFPLLSRLPLWYARYKPEIGMHFPKGNWRGYLLWQFVSNVNCSQKSCPYRMAGTPLNIDINVAAMSPRALRAAWPFGHLLDPIHDDEKARDDSVAEYAIRRRTIRVPMPTPRVDALEGNHQIRYGAIPAPLTMAELEYAYSLAGPRHVPGITISNRRPIDLAKHYRPLRNRSREAELITAGILRDALHQRLDAYVASLRRGAFKSASGVDAIKTSAAR